LSPEQVHAAPYFELPPGEPTVVAGSALDQRGVQSDSLRLLENGYSPVGWSLFRGGAGNPDSAKEQGRQLGAHLVVLYSRNAGVLTGVVAIAERVPQAALTNEGGVNILGEAFYHITRFDFGATYWVKLRRPILGASVEDVPWEVSEQVGRPTGAVVIAVIRDSPARSANFIRGDIIVRLADREVTGLQTFNDAVLRHAGEAVDVVFIRHGEEQLAHVQLNPKP
jgi:hypothetical protein